MAMAKPTTTPAFSEAPTRRGLLAAAFLATPAVLAAPHAVASPEAFDPILAHYRDWCVARNDWLAVPSGSAQADEASDREWAALDAMADLAPTSPAGVAALAHLLWNLVGPQALPGTERFVKACDEPGNRIVAALWRFGSGQDGLPPDGDAPFDPMALEGRDRARSLLAIRNGEA